MNENEFRAAIKSYFGCNDRYCRAACRIALAELQTEKSGAWYTFTIREKSVKLHANTKNHLTWYVHDLVKRNSILQDAEKNARGGHIPDGDAKDKLW